MRQAILLPIASVLLILSCTQPIKEKEDTPLFTPGTSTTIHVKVVQLTDTLELKARALNLMPFANFSTEPIFATTPGDYYIQFLMDRKGTADLTMNDSTISVVVVPDDTTDITLTNQSIQFSGNYTLENQYLLDKQKTLGYYDQRHYPKWGPKQNFKYNEFALQLDGIAKRELDFLHSYSKNLIDKERSLAPWFVDQQEADITYSVMDWKLEVTLYAQTFNLTDDIPAPDYLNFVSPEDLMNDRAYNSEFYPQFLAGYLLVQVDTEKYQHLAGAERVSTIYNEYLKLGAEQFTPEVFDYLKKYMLGDIASKLDSAQIVATAETYGIDDYQYAFMHPRKLERSDKNSLKIGDEIPEMYLTTTDDELFELSSLKGKVVYVDVWSSYCKPCLQATPDRNKLIREYVDNNEVVFLNISFDSEKQIWLNTINKYSIQGLNVLAEGNWQEKINDYLQVNGIPHYAFINKEMRLAKNHAEGPVTANATIDQLLAN